MLLDIRLAAERILEFTREMRREDFLADLKTQSAVLHQLLVLGEAVKRLSQDFRAAHAETPWPLIAGTRDRLIHEYDAVDLEEVWGTARRDIPDLLARVSRLLSPGD